MPAADGRPRSATLGYAIVWVCGGVVAALVIIGLIRLIGGTDRTVAVNPVLQPSLDVAARSAACRVAHTAGAPRPPEGTEASAPGLYEAPIAPDTAAATVYGGLVIIEYRPGEQEAVDDTVQELLQEAPETTVIAPDPGLSDAVRVSAWRRSLHCPRFDTATVDAVRLFRGRFVGRAPGG